MTENPPFFVLPLNTENAYHVRYRRTLLGSPKDTSVSIFDASGEDISNIIRDDYNERYKDDPNYALLSINCERWDLSARIRAVREMFELGHKVRAETKIRNRQALRKAYILFADPKIQDFMRYIDCGKREYAEMFIRELNVFNVEFIECELDRFFYFVLKPNFRALGQRGFGKQAQALKTELMGSSLDDRAAILDELKDATIEHPYMMCGVPLTASDIEIEYVAKDGFMGANGKVGSIILDTTLDDGLVEHGTVADFKSLMQNVRKLGKLDLLDRIELEVYCSVAKMNVLMKHISKLKKELLANNVSFVAGSNLTKENAFEIELDGEKMHVLMYKVA